jgi:hypothetical protein
MRIQKPGFMPYAKTEINTVYQNLDLYRIPKPRFIGFRIRYKSRFWQTV